MVPLHLTGDVRLYFRRDVHRARHHGTFDQNDAPVRRLPAGQTRIQRRPEAFCQRLKRFFCQRRLCRLLSEGIDGALHIEHHIRRLHHRCDKHADAGTEHKNQHNTRGKVNAAPAQ
jgi:hypothetical protein